MPAAPPVSKLTAIRAAVRRIPRGKVATYGAVAEAAGLAGAARLVVWALRQSGEFLPWYRVLGAGGHIRLPGTGGMEQRLRLQTEGVTFRGKRVRMDEHEFKFGFSGPTNRRPQPEPSRSRSPKRPTQETRRRP